MNLINAVKKAAIDGDHIKRKDWTWGIFLNPTGRMFSTHARTYPELTLADILANDWQVFDPRKDKKKNKKHD